MSEGAVLARIMRSVEFTRSEAPRVLLYTPVVNGNPFQELLYGALWGRGIAPIPVPDARDLRYAAHAVEAGGLAAVHLHWTTNLFAGCSTDDDVRRVGSEFLEMIEGLRNVGVKFIWTVHNRLPHDCQHPISHVEFRRQLAELADIIHVMSAHAVAYVGQLYELPPEKVVVIPHPAYLGVYPSFATQIDARVRLDLGVDDLVIAAVGGLRPYKQLDRLHEAFRAASMSNPRLRLVVAGAPAPDMAKTLDDLRRDPWVVVIARQLPDRAISDVIIASDVVACAYDSPITSGASILAMSLGRPVIAPRRPVTDDVLGDAAVVVNPDDAEEFRDCLRSLDRDDLRKRGARAFERASAVRYDIVAQQFADAIGRSLDLP